MVALRLKILKNLFKNLSKFSSNQFFKLLNYSKLYTLNSQLKRFLDKLEMTGLIERFLILNFKF